MDEEKAKKILADMIQPESNGLSGDAPYVYLFSGEEYITLDGEFSAEKLQALAWWMENKKEAN